MLAKQTILYARNSEGKIKSWKIQCFTEGELLITYCTGINLDRGTSSVITVTKSTILKEFDSRVKAKKREGYKELSELLTLKGINLSSNQSITYELIDGLLPNHNLDLLYRCKGMKCVKFRDASKKSRVYPMIVQAKINGVRSLLGEETVPTGEGLFANTSSNYIFRSMEGLEYLIDSSPVKGMMTRYTDNYRFDGELYIRGRLLNEIRSAIPIKYDNGVISDVSRKDLTNQVMYYIFDLAIEGMSQFQRIRLLYEILGIDKQISIDAWSSHKKESLVIRFPDINIVLVRSFLIYSDEEAEEFAKKCIERGYEGAVFRNLEAEYRFGSRTIIMQKLKFFEDKEFEIVDIIPKPGMLKLGMIVCKNDLNDETFTVNSMGSFEYQENLLTHKEEFIGKLVTVKFYERSGVKQCPFHANALIIRDYE